MENVSRSTDKPLPAPPERDKFRSLNSILRVPLYAGLICAIAATGYAILRVTQERAVWRASDEQHLTHLGLSQTSGKRLATEYSDKNSDLLPDAPSDPKELLDPDTLVLAHYKDAEAETQLIDWSAFQAHLAQATRKKVVTQEYLNTADEVAAMKTGEIHLVALHAADAPFVVNNAGFVPFAVVGTEAGAHGNHLDIAVPPTSNIKTLADLRGRTLTCTSTDSITGYRAAIAVLAEKTGMRPNIDYFINFSFGQKRSILGLKNGDFEVVALSEDKLQELLKDGEINRSEFNVIFESEVIPRLTIGHIYNLKPELASQLVAASLAFANEGGAGDEATARPMRFFASDYKQDFEFVRKIDDWFDPRFQKRLKTTPAPTPTTDPPLNPGANITQ